MKLINFILFFFFSISFSYSQEYSNYTNDTLAINSMYLKENININLHLPKTLNKSLNKTKYPITIIFDSQNEKTYPHIISSIDLLTSEVQMPSQIIIGVPFNRYNRLYLTSSDKKENDEYMGIERTESFLFNELIPKLINEYKANDFITVIGHSRSAFLVNYLTLKKSKEINIAIALSGFFDEIPITTEKFESHTLNKENFPNKFRYYFTAGSTLEERNYLIEYESMLAFFEKNKLAENFKPWFNKNNYANHTTNFWTSIPPILIDAYSGYNAILDNWFHNKTKLINIKEPIIEFKKDLKKVSKEMGFDINPNLTHIYSLASYLSNQKKDYKSAITFVQYGLELFPDELDFHLYLIEFNTKIGNEKMISLHKGKYKNKVEALQKITKKQRTELLKNIEE